MKLEFVQGQNYLGLDKNERRVKFRLTLVIKLRLTIEIKICLNKLLE